MSGRKLLQCLAVFMAVMATFASMAMAIQDHNWQIFYQTAGSVVGLLFLSYVLGVWD